jgi:hypothetical protein
MATCALCLKEAKLCRSHIVPEFIFSKLYGLDHEYHVLRADAPQKVIRRSLAEKLLCQCCEQKISVWEGYASQIIYGGGPTKPLRGTWVHHLLQLHDLEYKPLKLFLMSLLWRAAATSIAELRAHDLGPEKEKLRVMLLEEDPGEPWQYGCFFTAVMLGTSPADVIFAPSPVSHEGYDCWRLVMGGFLLTYTVSSHAMPPGIVATFLQREGTMVISRKELHEIPYLLNIMQTLDPD